MSKQAKAVVLISGGLDSMLAVRVLQEQGVYVEGINFFTGFCVEGHTHAIRKQDQKKEKRNNALWVAEQLGIKLHIEDVIEEYKDVLVNPKHGYGANMNPCLDCKTFMVRKGLEWIKENDFDFVATGEVIGQRPMSQRRDAMNIVTRDSGAKELLVRPLCAQNLPETYPEQQGWINRDKMYDFSGRSRKPQMALAEEYGFDEYAQPAGGCCFLTDESYSKKLIDLWQVQGHKEYEFDDIMLLKVGRHIRPRPHFKLIVGREEGENRFMEGYKKQFGFLFCQSHPGPLVLVDGTLEEGDLELAAQITAHFGKAKKADSATIIYTPPAAGEPQPIEVTPSAEKLPPEWYL